MNVLCDHDLSLNTVVGETWILPSFFLIEPQKLKYLFFSSFQTAIIDPLIKKTHRIFN